MYCPIDMVEPCIALCMTRLLALFLWHDLRCNRSRRSRSGLQYMSRLPSLAQIEHVWVAASKSLGSRNGNMWYGR